MILTIHSTPPGQPRPGEVHLWVTSLSDQPEQLSLFSGEELQMAQKFKNPTQWMKSRLFLRKLLSQYLQLPPQQIEFTYGKQGKPTLSHLIQSNPPLLFNVSHSNHLLICGVTASADLGVDIEYQGKERPFDELAKRFFPDAETQDIQASTGEHKNTRFYTIWTKKEALLKGIGVGLYGSLKAFTVKSDTGCVNTLPSLSFDPYRRTWHLFSLPYDARFILSIATAQPLQRIWLNDWPNLRDQTENREERKF